jgi:hypothetical protein
VEVEKKERKYTECGTNVEREHSNWHPFEETCDMWTVVQVPIRRNPSIQCYK